MKCTECRRRGALLSALIFVLFAFIFALLCAGGKMLLLSLTREGAAGETAAAVRRIIVIDAGHGGEDGGTVGVNGVTEKELNLLISRELADLFRAAGYTVLETRTDDRLLYDRDADFAGRKKVLDLAARLRAAEEADCSLFLSIHQNSFPEEKYSGLQVYYSPNTPESADYAEAIQSAVRTALQPDNNRAVKPAGKNIFLLDRLACPAVLVECGFLSNAAECERLCSADYRRELCLTIYAAAAGVSAD